MQNSREIKNLFQKYNLKPLKSLGQNFLIDKNVLRKIIETASISPQNTVLEIGPGLGILTLELAKRAKKVIAIEKDKKLCDILLEMLDVRNVGNVEVINGDILNAKYELPNTSYKVVANLPYYITSPVIRKFLESENQPQEMVLMVQKEVAQRICAKPPHMNMLAVAVQFYVHPVRNKISNGAGPKIISYVSKNSFWPQPKVDSAIIKIVPNSEQRLKLRTSAGERARLSPKATERAEDRVRRLAGAPNVSQLSLCEQDFFKLVKAGFSSKRKQLINSLSKGLKLKKETIKNLLLKAEINPETRAENLTIENWLKLYENYKPR